MSRIWAWTSSLEDPEPWIHRWANDRNETMRSDTHECDTDACRPSFEPRSKVTMLALKGWKLVWVVQSRIRDRFDREESYTDAPGEGELSKEQR